MPQVPESGEGVFPLPQAFSVEQTPKSVSRAHFHDEDQFQVFPQGAGTLGRHGVAALTVQYTNRQTAYGPIVAGDQGLTYFTLRQVVGRGIWYLGDANAKAKLDPGLPKRGVTVGPIKTCSSEELRGLSEAQTDVVIAPHEDGLAAWLVRVPIGATFESPVHPAGTGRFFLVTGGSMRLQGEDLPMHSTTFISHDEKNFRITAGTGGVEVLVMQFPGGQRVLERRVMPKAH